MPQYSVKARLGINSTETLGRVVQAAQQVGKRARVHIKVDTGLSRNGVTMQDLDGLIMELLRERQYVDVVGVMSHFAYADEPTNPTIALQTEQFALAVDKLTAAGFDLENRAGRAGRGGKNPCRRDGEKIRRSRRKVARRKKEIARAGRNRRA